MSKRDDDPTSDMEVGMTTAERRRRRRRGGSLRVPSDNVPRRSTTPPVVAPVPEDPSLAMSIAYSFATESSGAVAVPTFENPEPMPTVIDPPSQPVEQSDFESATREMTAVDLAALGLQDPSASTSFAAITAPMERISAPSIETVVAQTTMVEVRFANAATDPGLPPKLDHVASARGISPLTTTLPGAGVPPEPIAPQAAPTSPGSSAPALPPIPYDELPAPPATEPEVPLEPTVIVAPEPRIETRVRAQTMALSEADLEEVREAARLATMPAAAPVAAQSESSEVEIDAYDALDSGGVTSAEFEVDVEESESSPEIAALPAEAPPAERRSRPPSVPPAMSTQGAHAPPPTPLAAHKTPPAPPPKKPSNPPSVPAAAPSTSTTPTPPPKDKPSRGKPWFVDLFDEDYLRTLPFLTPQATQAEAEFVIDAMGLSPGAQVLDIGCGYGRHAMELAARGFHVVGLDLSAPLLMRGSEEAQRRGLAINFVRGDMRDLEFDAQFDGAYCLFSTYGYFDDETNKKTIQNIARALKPGGRVLIEILNRDYVIADLPTRVWWEGEGCVVLEEVELNYFSSRIQVNRSVVFDDGRQLEQEISVRAYSLHEVGKLLHAAGFRVLEVSGAYHTRGRFFGNQSRHIIVLAERKDAP